MSKISSPLFRCPSLGCPGPKKWLIFFSFPLSALSMFPYFFLTIETFCDFTFSPLFSFLDVSQLFVFQTSFLLIHVCLCRCGLACWILASLSMNGAFDPEQRNGRTQQWKKSVLYDVNYPAPFQSSLITTILGLNNFARGNSAFPRFHPIACCIKMAVLDDGFIIRSYHPTAFLYVIASAYTMLRISLTFLFLKTVCHFFFPLWVYYCA